MFEYRVYTDECPVRELIFYRKCSSHYQSAEFILRTKSKEFPIGAVHVFDVEGRLVDQAYKSHCAHGGQRELCLSVPTSTRVIIRAMSMMWNRAWLVTGRATVPALSA